MCVIVVLMRCDEFSERRPGFLGNIGVCQATKEKGHYRPRVVRADTVAGKCMGGGGDIGSLLSLECKGLSWDKQEVMWEWLWGDDKSPNLVCAPGAKEPGLRAFTRGLLKGCRTSR